MLQWIKTQSVGPAQKLHIEFGSRFNLFTGDNGLGKTFILDLIWWCLTGSWADSNQPAMAKQKQELEPTIEWKIAGIAASLVSTAGKSRFEWTRKPGRPHKPGLVVYMKSDGRFSLYDSAYHYSKDEDRPFNNKGFHFTQQDLWYGLKIENHKVCRGLLADWLTWQESFKRWEFHHFVPDSMKFMSSWDATDSMSMLSTEPIFKLFRDVLILLSPSEEELLQPGREAIALQDADIVPTLKLPYETIPITLISHGMKRILSLAYLLVWAWQSHLQEAERHGKKPVKELLFLVDEIEAHLHPQWQRRILPALAKVAEALDPALKIQIVATTHAPLVCASLEPLMNTDSDKQYTFRLKDKGTSVLNRQFGEEPTHDVVMEEEDPLLPMGPADVWLQSVAFGLAEARSLPAEHAMTLAAALVGKQGTPKNESVAEVEEAIAAANFPDFDPFLQRWHHQKRKWGLVDAGDAAK